MNYPSKMKAEKNPETDKEYYQSYSNTMDIGKHAEKVGWDKIPVEETAKYLQAEYHTALKYRLTYEGAKHDFPPHYIAASDRWEDLVAETYQPHSKITQDQSPFPELPRKATTIIESIKLGLNKLKSPFNNGETSRDVPIPTKEESYPIDLLVDCLNSPVGKMLIKMGTPHTIIYFAGVSLLDPKDLKNLKLENIIDLVGDRKFAEKLAINIKGLGKQPKRLTAKDTAIPEL